ncbi:MAG: GNAT family N-acetyltransferase [Bacteroidota bacterium]
MYEAVTVESKSEWKQFLALPAKIYAKHGPAIPLPAFEVRRLLDTDSNPALRMRTTLLLLVRRDGEPVGRCSLVMPGSSAEATAVFGFFECLDDQYAADTLLNHAEEVCRSRGVRAIHGPFSPTTSGQTGIQLDRYDETTVLYEACSPPYYSPLLEKAGYALEQIGRTWRNVTLRADMDALIARLPHRPSRYHIRQVSLTGLQRGVDDLARVFEIAFSENWSREAMSAEEYLYVARFLLPAWRPDSFTIVCDDEQPVGAAVCFPDINAAFRSGNGSARAVALFNARRQAGSSRSLLMFVMGIHPSYQNSAAGLELARHVAGIARNYETMHSTWITEGNSASERMASRFGLAPWKTFGVYRKNF